MAGRHGAGGPRWLALARRIVAAPCVSPGSGAGPGRPHSVRRTLQGPLGCRDITAAARRPRGWAPPNPTSWFSQLTLIRNWQQCFLEANGLKKLMGPFQAVNALLGMEPGVTPGPSCLLQPHQPRCPPDPMQSSIHSLRAAATPWTGHKPQSSLRRATGFPPAAHRGHEIPKANNWSKEGAKEPKDSMGQSQKWRTGLCMT